MRRGGRRRGGEAVDDVIDAAKRGDADAIASLYREHVSMVRGYLRISGVREPDDVTSEVFVAMVRSLPRFEGNRQQFRSWLMTIAHRRMVDYRRRSATDRSIAVGQIDDISLPIGEFQNDEPLLVDSNLAKAFARLTTEQREVLGLRFLADLDVETVAAITGRSAGAVKALQHRAIASLRRGLPSQNMREAAGQ